MLQQELAIQQAREVTGSKTELAKVTERIQELYDCITRRNYDVFEGSGRMMGRDRADWFSFWNRRRRGGISLFRRQKCTGDLCSILHNAVNTELDI